MSICNKVIYYFIRKLEYILPARKLIIINGDSLPENMPLRSIILAKDGDDDWSIGLRCPCGCGRTIELLIIDEARPRWDYYLNSNRLLSLHPSVWLKDGCQSHFWVKNGRIVWV
ncbi:MAG: DUF6527 family protein [Enterobacter hormaechei]|jgi:hypothetical protein|nr:DUF6527 family protein [Leclercia adecarboxylata]MDK4743958.1 DUF6527 family protein [Leclercia adecarboxylata]MDU2723339.1 DUF6527 family protein [Enterobacter hormaechei]